MPDTELGLHLAPAQPVKVTDMTLALDKIEIVTRTVPPSESFIATIKEYGPAVVPPLLVVKLDGKFVLRDGLRRHGALTALGFTSHPCKVVEMDATSSAALALVMNHRRTENPLAELDMIDGLIKASADFDDIVKVTGLTRRQIGRKLLLKKLRKAFLMGLSEGKIRLAVAEAVSRLPLDVQDELVIEFKNTGKLPMTLVDEIRRKHAPAQPAADMIAEDVMANADAAAKEIRAKLLVLTDLMPQQRRYRSARGAMRRAINFLTHAIPPPAKPEVAPGQAKS